MRYITKKTKHIADFPVMPINNFGDLQMKYLSLSVPNRAAEVLSDAEQAFNIISDILAELAKEQKTVQAISNLRKNDLIISRIRPSEAKSMLMDDSLDFINLTSKKLSNWYKFLQSVSNGNARATIIQRNLLGQYSITSISNYLALVKLITPEITKLDSANKDNYDSILASLRRAITIISDCEYASELNSVVLH